MNLFQRLVIAFWLLAFATLATAQGLTITGGGSRIVEVERVQIVKEKLTLVSSFPFSITAPTGGFLYSWDLPPGVTSKKRLNTLEITAAPKGEMVVSVEWVTFDAANKPELKAASVLFVVGEVVPPKPPEPQPPDPGPAPIPVEGFRVLIVIETADAAKLPSGQLAILTSAEVRTYLNSKCVLGPDNKTREYRIWDQHISIEGESQLWKNAMARKRDSLPWIIISTGKSGFEGPLPKTIPETIALLKKYAE